MFGHTTWKEGTAEKIRAWLRAFKIPTLPLRILKAVFMQAWRERHQSSLAGSMRLDRSAVWWEAAKQDPKRRKRGTVQSRQGEWQDFETPFVIAFGLDWRSMRDTCATKSDWKRLEPRFVQVLATYWQLEWLHEEYSELFPTTTLPAGTTTPTTHKCYEYAVSQMTLPRVIEADVLWDVGLPAKQIEFVVDNEQAAKLINGESVTADATLIQLVCSIQAELFCVFGACCTRRQHGAPVVWRSRELNTAADVMANIGLQGGSAWDDVDRDTIRQTPVLQCHSDGGHLQDTRRGSYGFTLTTWKHDGGEWTRSLAGYGCGGFANCDHSLHAELVALFETVMVVKRTIL